MGLFWRRRKPPPESNPKQEFQSSSQPNSSSTHTSSSSSSSSSSSTTVENGDAAEQKEPGAASTLPVEVNVFEFGIASTQRKTKLTDGDEMTLAGYCPLSRDLEACQWELLPKTGAQAPRFRIIF